MEFFLVFNIRLETELFLSFNILFSVRVSGRINAFDWNAFCTQEKEKPCSKYTF